MSYYLSSSNNNDYKTTGGGSTITSNSNNKLKLDSNNANKKNKYYFNNDNYEYDYNYNSNNNNSTIKLSDLKSYNRDRAYNDINHQFNNSNNNNNYITSYINKSNQINLNEILISSSSDNDEKVDIDDECDLKDLTVLKNGSTDSSYFSKPSSIISNANVNNSISNAFKCKKLNKFFNNLSNNNNNSNRNEVIKFEDLQKFFIILRKTLNKMLLKQNDNSNQSNNQYIKQNQLLAFDNLTYTSSIESINEMSNESTSVNASVKTKSSQKSHNTNNSDLLSKKTLKSIKRKDKLKKETQLKPVDENDVETIQPVNQNASNTSNARRGRSRSRQRGEQNKDKTTKKSNNNQTSNNNSELVESICISNKEFEKQLRRKYRCKSVARSIRRAKTVYYLNRRSKSLENLTSLTLNELKLKFPDEDDEKLNKMALSKANSIMSSCSSFTSATSCASDLSSSYFNELNNWSPELSDSDSFDSDSISLEDVDWDANLPDLPLSEYCSSSDDDDDDENDADDEFECDCNLCTTINNNQLIRETNENNSDISKWHNLISIMDQKYDITFEALENMLSIVMTRMLNMHPSPSIFNIENVINCPAPIEFINTLPITQVTTQYLTENKSKHDCSICLASLELQEDITTMPCSHTFHIICVKVWLSKSATCPICRFNYSNASNGNPMVSNRETLI